ncbi:MAG: ABC transporter substrate-binding protein [Geminicoccaceae bacterium]|nr:ABC transporter substrate-binding protein [Geminicoccaceae bacterium]MCS7268852.1 ABC transporter substrate-binding protein [Geminicoccaceae bacterium]MCX7630377.1 ABC transporter substrate-binding protein [Geminicoccaceae bacterium]MDW8125229.1 ABC transporter substrate-binding protein [Geminicoccaceae bacterium]MDW8341018.1 ABC transporter substrate-binding protein [Geminicoccaceae bacterium]
MNRRRLATGVASAILLCAALPLSAAEPIKIGSFLSVTGPASFLGDPEKRTLELYVQKINAAGGVLGRKLELVIYDDGGDPSAARTFATRLVESDKVVAVVGGTTTATSMAAIPVFEEAQIPFISLAGGIEIVEPVKPFTFKTPHTDKMACEKIFTDIKKRGLAKVGLISSTAGFGASMRTQCLKVAPAHGIEIVADERYAPGDTDTTPQLNKIKASGAQAIVNADFGQGPAIVTRNVRQLGLDLPLYQSHGVASKSFIDLAGPAAEGVRLPAAAMLVAEQLPDHDPQKKVVLEYKQTYESTQRQPVSTFGGHAYDGLMLLVQAIQRAGSTDGVKIRDALRATKGFIGTGGVVNMSATDHMGLDLSAFRMLEIRGGDWKLLY